MQQRDNESRNTAGAFRAATFRRIARLDLGISVGSFFDLMMVRLQCGHPGICVRWM